MSKRGTNREVLKTIIDWSVVLFSLLAISVINQAPGNAKAKNSDVSKPLPPIKIAATSNRLNETDLETLKAPENETEEERNKEELVVARVISVSTKSNQAGAASNLGNPEIQRVKAVIMEGRLKGSELDLTNELSENPTSNIYVKPGQELVLALANAGGTRLMPSIVDVHRTPILIWLSAIFLLALVILGGQEGLKRMIALACTLTAASLMLLPLTLSGLSPMVLTLLLSILASMAFILFVHGMSKASMAAAAGTTSGIITTAVCSQVAVWMLPLSGLTSQPSHLLRSVLLVHTPEFYRDILTSGIIFGISGAVIAVSTSISQFAQKQANSNSSITAVQLYSAALLTGRDFMGKMTSAVLLLSAGGALPLVLLATQMPPSELLNMDLTATLITSSISGCFGILASVPVTAIVCARIMPTRKR
ncbi:MAG: YibE/F family protein [Cyanobacteria bacterium]|nr:YibE/F family protein [Cyanobacteriota bacterium]